MHNLSSKKTTIFLVGIVSRMVVFFLERRCKYQFVLSEHRRDRCGKFTMHFSDQTVLT